MSADCPGTPRGTSDATLIGSRLAHAVGIVALGAMVLAPPEIRSLAREHSWRLLLVPLVLVLARPAERLLDRLAGRSESRAFLLALLFGSMMSGALLWRLVNAEWSCIDDHEIVGFLGPDQQLGWSGFLSGAADSEIFRWGTSSRYRPVYYALRLLECLAWGPRLAYWYATRIALLGVSLGCALFVMRRPLGWLAALALTSFLMTGDFWADVWSRLGPSEIYCIPGTALFLVGFQLLWNVRTPVLPAASSTRVAGIASLSVGFVLAVGAKENLLVLALPVFALLARSLVVRPVSRATALACAALLALGVVIALGIARGVSVAGHVYDKSTSLSVPFRSVVAPNLLPFWVAVALALAAAVAMRVRSSDASRSRTSFMALPWLTWMGAGLAAYLSQVAFYGQPWPTHSRYDFPGVIIPLALPALLLVLVHDSAREAGYSPEPFKILRTWLSAGLVALVALKGFDALVDSTRFQVAATRGYTSALRTIQYLAKGRPDLPVVISVGNVMDYEPVAATTLYLTFLGLPNPRYLDIRYAPGSFVDPLRTRLSREMHEWSAEGHRQFGFRPIRDLGDALHIGALFPPYQTGWRCEMQVRMLDPAPKIRRSWPAQ